MINLNGTDTARKTWFCIHGSRNRSTHLLQSHVIQIQLLQRPPQRSESIWSNPANRVPRQPQVPKVRCPAQRFGGHLFQLVAHQVERIQLTGMVQSLGRHVVDTVPSEVEGSEALRSAQDVWFKLGDGVVFQMKGEQAWEEFEGSFGEDGEAVLLQVEVSQLRESCGLNTK